MYQNFKLSEFLIGPETPILQAMELLNSQSHEFQFVIIVDKHAELLGTLTDGDIRRTLLSGRPLDGAVKDFMRLEPKFGHVGDDEEKIVNLLSSITGPTQFLPLVDAKRIVVDVRFGGSQITRSLDALVLAGGFGKRLGEKTKNHPKPLLTVRGAPLIEHVLQQIEAAGVRKTYLAVHYLADQIKDFVVQTGRARSIEMLYENAPLGTAGAIGMLPKNGFGDLLVTNSDVLTGMDYGMFSKYHQKNNFDATIAVANHRVQIPFGVIKHDKSGEFLRLDEKPILSNYVSAGVYCLNSSFLNFVDENEKIDMPALLARGKENGLSIGVFPIYEEWHDVGSPEDFELANQKMEVKSSEDSDSSK